MCALQKKTLPTSFKRKKKRLLLQCRCGFDPWIRKIRWRREWPPTPAFLPGESHGQRGLAGHSPQGHQESDAPERLNRHSCRQMRVYPREGYTCSKIQDVSTPKKHSNPKRHFRNNLCVCTTATHSFKTLAIPQIHAGCDLTQPQRYWREALM